MSMVGSLIVDFGKMIGLGSPFPYFKVTINGILRYSHTKDALSLYSTHLNIGDVVLFEAYNYSARTNNFTAQRFDYTTDNNGNDLGIKETLLTGYSTSNSLSYTFTANTISTAYNFEYRLYNDISPTPTPTPTQTPIPTFTPTPTNTSTPAPTPTNTSTPAPTPTITSTATPTPTPTLSPYLIQINWIYEWEGVIPFNLYTEILRQSFDIPALPFNPIAGFYDSTSPFPYSNQFVIPTPVPNLPLNFYAGSYSGITYINDPDFIGFCDPYNSFFGLRICNSGTTDFNLTNYDWTFSRSGTTLMGRQNNSHPNPDITVGICRAFSQTPVATGYTGFNINNGDIFDFYIKLNFAIRPTPTPTPTPTNSATPTPTPSPSSTIAPPTPTPTGTVSPTPTPTSTPTPTGTVTPTPTPTPTPSFVTLQFNAISSTACSGLGCASTSGTLIQYFDGSNWITKTGGSLILSEGSITPLRIFNGSAGLLKAKLRTVDNLNNDIDCIINNSLGVGSDISVNFFASNSLLNTTVNVRPEACRTSSTGGGSCGAPNYSC